MPHSIKLVFALLLAIGLGVSSCARTAIRGTASNAKRVVFQFSVRGRLGLDNPNVTYYLVLNAPDKQENVQLDPASQGPRINGPSLNDQPTTLLGRLPFLGLLPGDVPSQWTHFYFVQGTADGKGSVGRGLRRADGTPEIVLRNYSDALWKQLSESTVQVQIPLNDLIPDGKTPRNLVMHLASSDSVDSGQGFVYDWWRSNIPFSIDLSALNTPITDQDLNQQLVLRQIPGKLIPTLPQGVNPDDLDLLSYEYKVIQL